MKFLSGRLVSVIIPSYRRPKETLRAVESVLSQDYENLEVIVVDDNGSESIYFELTQSSLQKHFITSKIKFIAHIENLGGNAARNTGLMAATGYYISFLDSDDEFYTSKISSQVAWLNDAGNYNSNIKAVTCNR